VMPRAASTSSTSGLTPSRAKVWDMWCSTPYFGFENQELESKGGTRT
jgi:hypothetical protein